MASDLLKGFELVDTTKEVDFSVLTVTAKTLKFNKDTVRALQNPDFVQFMFNEKGCQLAVKACEEGAPNAVSFRAKNPERVRGIIVKSAYLQSVIGRFLSFEKDGQAVMYRVTGMNYPDERSIIYSLDEAEEIPVKPRKPRGSAAEKEKVIEDDGLF